MRAHAGRPRWQILERHARKESLQRVEEQAWTLCASQLVSCHPQMARDEPPQAGFGFLGAFHRQRANCVDVEEIEIGCRHCWRGRKD